jgi:DNA polymerase-1
LPIVALDTETSPILPGLIAPPMSCGTFAWEEGGEIETLILNYREALDKIEELLDDDEITVIGHNLPYDLGVACGERPDLIPKVFRKYEIGKARDTLIQQQQLDIASGEMKFFVGEDDEPKRTAYGLDAISYRLNKEFVKKEGTYRLKYGPLREVPVAEWPAEAIEYAINDARVTLRVHKKQMEIAGVPNDIDEIPNIVEQFKASWALHLMSVYGVRTDGAAVAKLKAELTETREEMLGKLRLTPFLKQVKQKGVVRDVRDMKSIRARVAEAYAKRGLKPPRTDPSDKFPDGQIGTDKKALEESGDKDLALIAEAIAVEKLLSTYVPVLERGTKVPINAHFNTLVESGRTSCSRPNLQNPPRKGGIRECFVPRGF